MTLTTTICTLLAQTAEKSGGAGSGSTGSAGSAGSAGGTGILSNPLFMIVLFIVMFYFLIIRPQQRQRKELQTRISSLQTGDKVVTTSGIHGIVHSIRDHTVLVKIAEGTMVEFDKPAIAVVHKKDAAK